MLVGPVIATIPFVLTAYGGPLAGRNPMCNVGTLHCCNTLSAQGPDSTAPSTPTGSGLLNLLNLNLSLPILSQVGTDCSPFSIAGLGSGSGCQATPACCTPSKSMQQGLLNFDCDPINLLR